MKRKIVLLTFMIAVMSLINYYEDNIQIYSKINYGVASVDDIPNYFGDDYIIINNNNPYFNSEELVEYSYEKYSDLDYLGRAGAAIVNIGKDIMPTEKRESIGNIKPTGWHTIKYDIIQDKYLYNRCHLIGYQLSGENDNKKNLITCTRQMNISGMLPFENMVVNYVNKTNNHVLYRVTPIYFNDNLLAYGVLMEAISIEDGGKGIKFNVFIYNVQDGIDIDYSTGESKLKK